MTTDQDSYQTAYTNQVQAQADFDAASTALDTAKANAASTKTALDAIVKQQTADLATSKETGTTTDEIAA